jgi:hypothetical protein
MEVREGNVVSFLLATIITTKLSKSTIVNVVTIDVAPLTLITIFVEEETGVGEDLDIAKDIHSAVQGVVTMHSIEEGDKQHLLLEVLPTLTFADPNMINLLGHKKYVDLINTTLTRWVPRVSFNVYPFSTLSYISFHYILFYHTF